MADPTTAIDRARETYKKLGRSEKWIQQRMTGQETRNKLTDYWKDHEISEGEEYAILTNIIHQEWSGLSVKEHKNLRLRKQENKEYYVYNPAENKPKKIYTNYEEALRDAKDIASKYSNCKIHVLEIVSTITRTSITKEVMMFIPSLIIMILIMQLTLIQSDNAPD